MHHAVVLCNRTLTATRLSLVNLCPVVDSCKRAGSLSVCVTVLSCAQASFQKLITGLQSLDYSILDVNSHRWHDDYNKFKAGIKDLEVMLTNVIQLGFDNASSLVSRIELLEVHHFCRGDRFLCDACYLMINLACAASTAFPCQTLLITAWQDNIPWQCEPGSNLSAIQMCIIA